MERYQVLENFNYVHEDGRKASGFGVHPNPSDNKWTFKKVGYTVYDRQDGTCGLYGMVKQGMTKEEVQALADRENQRASQRQAEWEIWFKKHRLENPYIVSKPAKTKRTQTKFWSSDQRNWIEDQNHYLVSRYPTEDEAQETVEHLEMYHYKTVKPNTLKIVKEVQP